MLCYFSNRPSVLIACLLASSHYARHAKDIIDGDTGEKSEHKNAVVNIPNAISVFSRNVGLQLALPEEKWNKYTEGLVEALHKTIGVSVNSLQTSFHDNPFAVIYWPNSEDNVTSILSIAFILVLPVFGLLKLLFEKNRIGFYYLLPLALLFSFSALLKWQPWHTRLIIPIEILASISVGLFFAGMKSVFLESLAVAFSAWWLFPCLKGWHRPVLGYQPVYSMNDLDQRAMKAPREAFDTIAFSEILSQIKPTCINLNAPFYPPLVYVGRNPREWPQIVIAPKETSQDDVVLRSIGAGGAPSTPRDGMIRLYQSDFAYLDVQKSLLKKPHAIQSPQFAGVEKISGMDEPIGPFPLSKQPIFCHAHFPEVGFDLPPRSKSGALTIEMALPYFNRLDENSCDIFLDDQKVGEIELKKVKKGKKIFSETIPIPACSKSCRVKLKFRTYDPASDSKVAASITGLRFSDFSQGD
jgi:hypothetical protein